MSSSIARLGVEAATDFSSMRAALDHLGSFADGTQKAVADALELHLPASPIRGAMGGDAHQLAGEWQLGQVLQSAAADAHATSDVAIELAEQAGVHGAFLTTTYAPRMRGAAQSLEAALLSMQQREGAEAVRAPMAAALQELGGSQTALHGFLKRQDVAQDAAIRAEVLREQLPIDMVSPARSADPAGLMPLREAPAPVAAPAAKTSWWRRGSGAKAPKVTTPEQLLRDRNLPARLDRALAAQDEALSKLRQVATIQRSSSRMLMAHSDKLRATIAELDASIAALDPADAADARSLGQLRTKFEGELARLDVRAKEHAESFTDLRNQIDVMTTKATMDRQMAQLVTAEWQLRRPVVAGSPGADAAARLLTMEQDAPLMQAAANRAIAELT